MPTPPRVRVPGRPARPASSVTDNDDAEVAAASIFSEIVAKIKKSQPTRPGDGSTQGFVFSFLEVGEPISPYDFAYQWSPIGGTRRDGALAKHDLTTNPGELPSDPAEDVSPERARAMAAAFNVGERFNEMLMVTADGTKTSYAVGRDLALQYANILAAMEAMPLPERSPEDVARIDAARAILFDADGYKTPAYARYEENSQAYQDAAADYAMASAEILADPVRADMAPMLLRGAKAQVDRAYHHWRADDTEKIEAALATVESLGIPLEQGMIAKARERLEAWTLPLVGVADEQAYTYILPSDWADPQLQGGGWAKIERSASQLTSYRKEHGTRFNSGEWRTKTKNGDANVDVNIAAVFGAGSRVSRDSTTGSQSQDSRTDDLVIDVSRERIEKISLEYKLCEIQRPWLDANLFRMKNYYLRGAKAGAISDGTIDGQVLSEAPLLPMVPTHLLVIRNIRAEFEASAEFDRKLRQAWASSAKSSSQTHIQRRFGAKGLWRVISGKVSAKLDEKRERKSFRTESGRTIIDTSGAWSDAGAFHIDGCQIIAYLSEVTPMSPPLTDPALSRDPGKPDPRPNGPARPGEEPS